MHEIEPPRNSVLITGLNGSLAPRVAQAAQRSGYTVIGWDRSAVSPDDSLVVARHLEYTKPQAIVHLAMGAESWAAALAAYALAQQIPFVFTSTAMVFDHLPDGPHAVGDERTAKDDYGRYKVRCEDAVLDANPAAMVARIGWQIDPEVVGNNMLRALDGWQEREGCVGASSAWRPACSFMEDTADALIDLLEHPQSGVLHLDSNAQEGHTFDRIAAALAARFERSNWRIRIHEDYAHDQRLAGGEQRMPALSTRLPALLSTP
jgi:dTDP-4-dehydrorhamnose reductase